jgi:hypothetical protein
MKLYSGIAVMYCNVRYNPNELKTPCPREEIYGPALLYQRFFPADSGC